MRIDWEELSLLLILVLFMFVWKLPENMVTMAATLLALILVGLSFFFVYRPKAK